MAGTKTYDVAGNREDLTDVLTILEPEATPVTSLAKKGKASGTFFEWQADSLDEVSFDGVLEGADASFGAGVDKAANRAKLGNYVQKIRREYQVSDLQQAVDTAAVPSEFANAQAKSVRECKRDLEAAICSADDRAADNGSTPYRTRGFFKWLGADGTQPSDIPAAFQNVANDTSEPQTEATFNSVLQELYQANGMPGSQLTLVAGPELKRQISDFARAEGAITSTPYQITQLAESKKITLTVNFYEGDFGNVAIVPSTFLNRSSSAPGTADTDAGLLIDPEYFGLHTLIAESTNELENRGGGRRGYVDLVAGLAVYSPKAHGYFA